MPLFFEAGSYHLMHMSILSFCIFTLDTLSLHSLLRGIFSGIRSSVTKLIRFLEHPYNNPTSNKTQFSYHFYDYLIKIEQFERIQSLLPALAEQSPHVLFSYAALSCLSRPE